MNIKQKGIILVIAMFFGFVGGFISNQLFTTKSAFGEKELKPQKLVVAEEFRLVDKKGETRATLSSKYSDTISEYLGTELQLFGKRANISLSVGGVGGANINLFSKKHPDKSFFSKVTLGTNGAVSHIVLGNDYPSKPLHVDRSDMIKIVANSYTKSTNITLIDENGYARVKLGNAYLTSKSGVDKRYPVSSFFLFSEKGNVLWSAP